MTSLLRSFLFGMVTVCVAGLLPFDAYALPSDAECSGDTLNRLFCNLGTHFSTVPIVVAIFSWITGVVLTLTGLLNLKAYGDDPTSVPLRTIVMKFVIAAMLITLPGAIQIIAGSVVGGSVDNNNNWIQGRPCIVESNLMSLRKGGGQSPCQ